MANGSEGERKQTEPEGKRTSQVRLWWEPMEGQRWVVTLPTLTLSVEPIDGGLQWSALVEVPNGADLCEYFATHEEAKKYCVEKARELLQQDLKSLRGDVQAEPAEVKPAPESDIEPVISLSLEGPGSTLKLQVDGEVVRAGFVRLTNDLGNTHWFRAEHIVQILTRTGGGTYIETALGCRFAVTEGENAVLERIENAKANAH